MVGDFSGFVAGTYLRGMPFVQVPTSLLSMVDASIGGKTAINHAGAKNIVGLFNQPKAVVADISTLTTLPRRALVEGMGEVIKHALIRDAEMLSMLEERLDDLMALEPAFATDLIARNMAIKGDVVSQDERETGGVRELLNYGHTLGHAFEAAGGYEALLHGEAVGAGMVAAAEIGKRVGRDATGARRAPECSHRPRGIADATAGGHRPRSDQGGVKDGQEDRRRWSALGAVAGCR